MLAGPWGSLASHIQSLVRAVVPATKDQTEAELGEIIECYGHHARLLLLQCLAKEIASHDLTGEGDKVRLHLIQQELAKVSTSSNSVTLFQEVLVAAALPHTREALEAFCETLQLPFDQQLLVGAAAVQAEQTGQAGQASGPGLAFLQSRLVDVDTRRGPLAEPPLLALLHFIFTLPSSEARGTLLHALRPLFPPLDQASLALRALLAPPSKGLDAMSSTTTSLEADIALAERVAVTCKATQFMKDLGYACVATASSFASVLDQVQPLTEEDVAQILGLMASTHTNLDEGVGLQRLEGMESTVGAREPTTWNSDVVVDVLREKFPGLRWSRVPYLFDYPGFFLPDPKGLSILMASYTRATTGMQEPFPLEAIFGRWKNVPGQISFLREAIAAPPEVFSFASSPRQQPPLDYGSNIFGTPNQAWCSLDLIETLLELESIEYAAVRPLFDPPLRVCPELLLLGISQVKFQMTKIQSEIYALLMPGYLASSHTILHRLWTIKPAVITKSMQEVYRTDPSSPPRLLDVAQDVKGLPAVLDAVDMNLAIELAVLAYRRESLNLEKWLQDKLAQHKDTFARTCLQYLHDRVQVFQRMDPASKAFHLSLETTIIFFKRLHGCLSILSSDVVEEFRQFYASCVQSHPQLLISSSAPQTQTHAQAPPAVPGVSTGNSGNGVDNTPRNGELPQGVFAPEIETEASNYFQKIYTAEQSVEDVVQMLRSFKNSKEQREQEVFACMIHNLFDEFQFFPKYPERELQITGILFGSLIHNQLVSSITLGIALRYVLEGLRKPPGSKMFMFGVCALDQFKSRVGEWPQYCSHILQIPHMRSSRQDLCEFIEKKLSEAPSPQGTGPVVPRIPSPQGGLQAPPSASPTTSPRKVAPSSPTRDSQPSFVTSLNMDTLLEAANSKDITAPDTQTQDRIYFIFNNVSLANMEEKGKKLNEFVEAEHYGFLAQYLVVKRVSIEPNFHQLYLAFLDKIGITKLNVAIVQETYDNIKILLKSEKLRTSSSERSLLKNLGSWLGSLTIAKNKPLLQKDLDLKDVLVNAFSTGRLIGVLPFVAKVLEACQRSKVIKPPNPWVMSIVGLLCEIYHLPELKLNLKFEVEVLMKHLQLDIKDIKPSNTLKDKPAPERVNNPDFTGTVPAPSVSPDITGEMISPPSPVPLPPSSPPPEEQPPISSSGIATSASSTPLTTTAAASPLTPAGQQFPAAATSYPEQTVIPNLASFITINPNITLFAQTPVLKRFVPLAIDRAIRDIISPVVERSVTIACITTRELILKDFAMEPDEQKMRRAAHLMVQSLAGSLALVTCKEPLRVSMSNHIRSFLQAQVGEPSVVEQVVQVISSENLELGCTIIEKAAMEKAVRDIDDALAPAYTIRQKHRSQTGQPYFDMSIFTVGRFPSALPDPLRPKPGGLGSQQLRVYEDFAYIHRLAQVVSQGQAVSQGGQTTQVSLDARSGSPEAAQSPRVSEQQEAKEAGPQKDIPPYATQEGPSEEKGPGAFPPEGSQKVTIPAAVLTQPFSPAQCMEKVTVILGKVFELVATTSDDKASGTASLQQEFDIRKLLQEIPLLVGKCTCKDEAVMAVARQAVAHLFHSSIPSVANMALEILDAMIVVNPTAVQKEVTNLVLYTDEERKFSDITFSLIRGALISVSDFTTHLSKLLDNGRNTKVMEYAIQLIQKVVVEEQLASGSQFQALIDAVAKTIPRQAGKGDLANLLEHARNQTVSKTLDKERERNRPMEVPAPVEEKHWLLEGETPSVVEPIVKFFDEWIALVNMSGASDKAFLPFLSKLQQHGMLKGDDTTDRMVRVFTSVCVERCEMVGADKQPNFLAVDALSKFIVVLFKYHGEPTSSFMKVNLLNKVLLSVQRVLFPDCEIRRTTFSQRPYFRLFVNLLFALNVPDPTLEPYNFQVLTVFSNMFHNIQPLRLPGFAFAWLELISHRMFLPRVFLAKGQKGWPLFQRLLVDLLHLLETYLRNAELNEAIRLLYKGTLRVLLVLLHDFPEFLCDYHFSFCDVIPPTCIQMRNLILSAFPRNMRLPDPFTPNLKVDLLPEIREPPRILSNYTVALGYNGLRQDLDIYLKTRGHLSFILELRNRLLLPAQEAQAAGTRYNVPVINALVLYVGIQAVAQTQSKSAQITSPITHSAPMDIFQQLAIDLDAEGRYLFLNAIANQLRYPNNHTHYFSCVLLYLFAEANHEIIQEQITRVLLERLIVARPHPWGLLITFIELIKNPRYNFWSHSFVRCAPDIERLFESVARSCLGPPKHSEDDATDLQPTSSST